MKPKSPPQSILTDDEIEMSLSTFVDDTQNFHTKHYKKLKKPSKNKVITITDIEHWDQKNILQFLFKRSKNSVSRGYRKNYFLSLAQKPREELLELAKKLL